MDPYQYSDLEKLILDLLEPGTTPEKALQIFSSPRFSPHTYGEEDTEPVMIFFAYLRFITMRLHDACVVGIWEDIIRKTFLYSKYFSESQSQLTLIRRISSPIVHSKIAPVGSFLFKIWLDEALSTHSKCPNPLIRLELFRLIRILGSDLGFVTCEKIWATFRYTICEIQPYHLYTRGDKDKPLFGIEDLEYLINHFCLHLKMHIIITNITMKELAKKNELYHKDNDIRFISHCIRLVGIFAMMADTVSLVFFSVLKHTLARIVKFEEHLDDICITKEQFQEILSFQPFRHFMIETIRDVTEAVLNDKLVTVDRAIFLMSLRDTIVQNLAVYTTMSDLPRLLLSRQVQSPMIVRQHSLLLEVLDTVERWRPEKNSKIEEDFDRCLQI